MRTSKKILVLIVFSVFLAGYSAVFAQSAPVNQCTMIPEIMNGKTAYEKDKVPYQPESCVASNVENSGDDEAAGA